MYNRKPFYMIALSFVLILSLFLLSSCGNNAEGPPAEENVPPAIAEEEQAEETANLDDDFSLTENIQGTWISFRENFGFAPIIYSFNFMSSGNVRFTNGFYMGELYSMFEGSFIEENKSSLILSGEMNYAPFESDDNTLSLQDIILDITLDGNKMYVSEISDFDFLSTSGDGGLSFVKIDNAETGTGNDSSLSDILALIPKNDGDVYFEPGMALIGSIVAEPTLNMRILPSTTAEIIGSLPKGIEVEILGKNETYDSGTTWYILLMLDDGWYPIKSYVSAEFVEIIG